MTAASYDPDMLRRELGGFMRRHELTSPYGLWPDEDPAEHFAMSMLTHVEFAASRLTRHGEKKKDLLAEYDRVTTSLDRARRGLRNASDDFDALLGPDLDPVEAAETLEAMLETLRRVEGQVAAHPGRPRQETHDLLVIDELAIRALREAKDWGLTISAYYSSEHGQGGAAVELMQMIGNALGHVREPTSWRDVVRRALEAAPDLRATGRASPSGGPKGPK